MVFRKRYCISRRQQNLIDLKLQYLFTNLVVLGVFIDQLKNAYLQDMTFNIWWMQFHLENIGKIISIKGESNKDIIHKDI